MQLRKVDSREECINCKYVGEMKEASMDKINSFRAGLRGGTIQIMQQGNLVLHGGPNGASNTQQDLKERMKKFSESEDFEIV